MSDRGHLRIGIDYTAAVQQGGGIGRLTRDIVRALAGIDSANHYTLFAATRGARFAFGEWPPNFRTRSVPVRDYRLAQVWHRLRLPLWAELLTGPVDVFHSPDFTLPPVLRARTIVTVHDLSFLRAPHCFLPELRRYLEKAVPRSVARADHVIANSQSTKADLVELLDVPAQKITVIYAGVEPRFRPIKDQATLEATRRKYDLPSHFILSLGTLQPRKNYSGLIAAFADLKPDCKLVIVGGKGWLSEEIFAAVERLDLQDDVIFPGFVDDADLPALYNLASAFALPSLYEGFGIPPLEAMACGVPVVTSNVSSLPEVVGEAGLMVAPQDTGELSEALHRLLTDDDLRARLIERGYARAASFTWTEAARKLLATYRRAHSEG